VAAEPKTIQVVLRVTRSVPPILKDWCHRLAIALALAAPSAVVCSGCANWAGVPGNMQQANRDFPPYRVAGNIYYVGSNDIALFLITTSRGHILLDSGFEASVPRLRDNIERLGFRYHDIKLILTSHAHIDHVQAHALVRQQTGAQVVVSTRDAPFVEHGGQGETVFDGVFSWTPCPVDRRVNDGDSVTLGETTLVAHLTPGHTLGATTWTMQTRDGEKTLDVVFFPSANVNRGVKLANNERYPNIARDFEHSFSVWKSLQCDLFLADHGEFYEMKEKFARSQRGEKPNPFIDPGGYRRFLARAEARFREQLESER
jgi:metallo-beta-lactamase class B